MKIDLKEPSPQHESTFLDGYAQLTNHSDRLAWYYCGESRFKEFRNLSFQEYVERLIYLNAIPPDDFVKGTVWWAFVGGTMVGRIGIRHELNDFLRVAGGHIGYIVAPHYRGQGVATEMLKQVLQSDRARAIGKILITCDEDNIASEKTILKNGGVLENVIPLPTLKKKKKRFWIHL